MGDDEIERLHAAGKLTDLPGIGPSTGGVIAQALDGEVPDYLARLEDETVIPLGEGAEIRAALRGDCHPHSTWSDGGAPIEKMARTAIALGHDYMVLTDHSPRLTIAHGLNPKRLKEQLVEVEALNVELAPFRILTGIEVDILEDGALDQTEELLARLDVVVASVHSKLRMERREMTRRMVAAVASPHVDILGHCTGRKVVGRGPAAVDVRRRDRVRGVRPVRHGARDQLPARAPGPARRAGRRWPSTGACASPSTPTPTPRARWSGRPTAATRRPATASSPSGSSTRWRPTTCVAWAGVARGLSARAPRRRPVATTCDSGAPARCQTRRP